MVLSTKEGELGLYKQLVAREDPRFDSFLNRVTHTGFVVMFPLIGRIDSSKSLRDRRER